jgi:DNA polymerase elongation subunit (family B)
MLLDIEQEGKSLIISYFDKKGVVDYKTYKFDEFRNWYITNENDNWKAKNKRNWDGRPVKLGRARILNKYSVFNFLDQLKPEDAELIFGYNFPKAFFVDIEVEVLDGFPHADRAESRILTLSIITPDNKVIVLGLKDLTNNEKVKIEENTNEYFADLNKEFGIEKWEFKYFKFDSEYDMLYTFLSKFVKKFPIMSGWNFIGFDWKYIVNRAKRLQIDASIASPSGKLNGKDLLPLHVGIVDYMDLYANWDKSIKIKENNKLETAAQAVLKKSKIKYNGGLQDLYNDDFQKYVYYNGVDSVLVYFIDRRLKTLQVALTLANICKISMYKASSPVSITESYLSRYFLTMNKVLAKDSNRDNNNYKDGKFQGAFVKEPIRGLYSAVACFDYASLYPSIMRMCNISPDVLLEKIPATQVEAERKKDNKNKIITVNGCVYSTEKSILKEVLTNLYSQRKEYKKEMFQHKMRMAEIKDIIKNK